MPIICFYQIFNIITHTFRIFDISFSKQIYQNEKYFLFFFFCTHTHTRTHAHTHKTQMVTIRHFFYYPIAMSPSPAAYLNIYLWFLFCLVPAPKANKWTGFSVFCII